MIREYFTKQNIEDVLEASFQKKILSHWQDISSNCPFPSKQDFRPQDFTKHLPKIAIVGFQDENFLPRLTGSAISNMQNHILGISRYEGENLRCSNHTFRDILNTCRSVAEPLYFADKLANSPTKQLDFTVLALPFSRSSESDIFDTILLAFDFKKKMMIDASK